MRKRRIWLGALALLFVAGVSILSASLILLSDGGPSKQAAEQLATAGGSRDQSTTGPGSTTAGPNGVTSGRNYAVGQTGMLYRRLIIDSIGVNAPIAVYGVDEEGVPQVPFNSFQVAWYEFSASPGEGDNAVFAGHLDWNGAPAVFAELKHLRVGDTVKVEGEDENLVYVVTRTTAVDPADPGSLRLIRPTQSDILTLVTCGGTWIPDDDVLFGGDYSERVVVQASLLSRDEPSGLPSTFGF